MTRKRCSSTGQATVSTRLTTMAEAMATVGTFHALSASEARAAMGAEPSNVWDFIIHRPSITPRMAVMAAMMNVTGMVAFTVV